MKLRTRMTAALGRISFAAAASAAAGFGVVPAAAAPADLGSALASHQAVYELKLIKASERSGLTGVDGRLVYEFTGSVCEGFTSQFRFVTRFVNNEGKTRITDLRTSTFEDGEGKSFNFLNQNYVDQRLVEESKGVAKLTGTGATAEVSKPQKHTVDFAADALFPTRHMATLIAAAKSGQSFADIKLYDGSENGDRVYQTAIVIGKEQTGPDEFGDEAGKDSVVFAGKRHWPVTISYYDVRKKSDDGLPEYQLSFLLYENGVTRKLKLDYGDFVLSGTLSELKPLEAKACP